MNHDITFCANPCDNLSCFRHVNNLPKSTPVSIANLYGTEYCPNILIDDFYTAMSSQIDELKNLRDMGINLRSTLDTSENKKNIRKIVQLLDECINKLDEVVYDK